MTRLVIDASAGAEYLLRTPLGRKIDPLLHDAFLLAPELLDVEILSILRRAVLLDRIEARRALLALEDLQAWPVERISHRTLARQAWQYRHNVSAYDAFYVAAAEVYDATLITADGPLSRAPLPGVNVRNVRYG